MTEISIIMSAMTIQSFIILLAIAGLALCVYINSTKRNGQPLVCPFDGACDFVVRSEYSIIFGINAEVLGMLYYAAIGLIFSASVFLQAPFYAYAILAGTALSAAGFLMSIYFMWIQFGVIKKWCTLCVSSALISTAIFALDIFSFRPMIAFLNP